MDDSKIADEEKVRPTDTAPMPKKVNVPTTVKIELDALPGHARITSKDRSIDTVVPTNMVAKKFADAAKVGFFKAHFASTVGSLEIDDRVDLPEEKRW